MAQWIDLWNSDDWRAETAGWIDAACDAYGIERTAEPEFWPTHLGSVGAAVETDAAHLVFTANAPGLAAEPAVTVTAGQLVPDRVVMPLAIDRVAGYMLSPDFGHALGEVSDSVESWELAMASLAALQVSLMGQQDAFFDAGLTVVDPQFLPEQYEQALTLHVSMDANHPLHLPPARADKLHSRLGELRAACTALHAGPVPLSLEHGAFDLHKVITPAEVGQQGRIVHFGSAHWAHPFSSLARPLALMQEQWDCTVDDERVIRVLFAYLGQFSDYGTPDELFDLIGPACMIAPLAQHETWLRLLLEADDKDVAEHAEHVLETLYIG